jgi:dTDP-4-dehydrorhamnose 3,5-epimerase
VKVSRTGLAGVLVILPDVHGDDRGWFVETWRARRYAEVGLPEAFVQDNLSMSRRGILRGLHFQHPLGQGKLVQVVLGEVYDVVVDVRVGSPTFGQWVGTLLSQENHKQVWIPAGFAHGFCVTSDVALFSYKCSEAYHRGNELGVAWNDPELGIEWPVQEPTLSAKDAEFPRLREIPEARLPRMARGAACR